jgi:hypothetical protein
MPVWAATASKVMAAGGEQFAAGVFDADGGFVGHGVSVRFMSWSRPEQRVRDAWHDDLLPFPGGANRCQRDRS